MHATYQRQDSPTASAHGRTTVAQSCRRSDDEEGVLLYVFVQPINIASVFSNVRCPGMGESGHVIHIRIMLRSSAMAWLMIVSNLPRYTPLFFTCFSLTACLSRWYSLNLPIYACNTEELSHSLFEVYNLFLFAGLQYINGRNDIVYAAFYL